MIATRSRPASGPPAAASAAWKQLICRTAADACEQALGSDLRALVLTGSLARDEATFVEGAAGVELLGDAEFLVLWDGTGLPDAAFAALSRRVQRELARRGLHGHVSLTGCRPAYLRRLRPHIFACELRACGNVVRGDRRILDLIPPFGPADIPREDAWRLLCNRLVELLDAAAGADAPWPFAGTGPDRARPLPPNVHYATVKLYLDMATSLLAFVGLFEPGYRARARRLAALAAHDGSTAVARFPLGDLAARVAECTAFKLAPSGAAPAATWTFCHEALSCARRLWRWELSELTGAGAAATDDDLWESWMSQQPLPRRLRGWLQAARRQGWLRGWRDRARWPGLAWRASPRYWVYRAAVALLWSEPGRLPAEERWEAWRERLPARAPGAALHGGRAAWRSLARDVAWNYHQFLVHTQS